MKKIKQAQFIDENEYIIQIELENGNIFDCEILSKTFHLKRKCCATCHYYHSSQPEVLKICELGRYCINHNKWTPKSNKIERLETIPEHKTLTDALLRYKFRTIDNKLNEIIEVLNENNNS